MTLGTVGHRHHDTDGLQIQPAGLLGGRLPQAATAAAGGQHAPERVCGPGGETGAAEALERHGLLPQGQDLHLPVHPGRHLRHHGLVHSDGGQEGPPPHAVPLPLQQPGQPGTLRLQPLLIQGLRPYQTVGQDHHSQGGVSQQSTAARAQSAAQQ